MRKLARTLVLFSLLPGVLSSCRKAPAVDTRIGVQSSVPDGSAIGGMAVMPVRVTYVLSALRASLDTVFPASDSLSEARCRNAVGLVCHQYVYRRDSLRIRSDSSRLTIDTRMQYRARVGTLGSARIAGCGYPPQSMRRAELSMSTLLYWRRDWKIGSRNTTFAAKLLDPCIVTALGINATRSLQSIIDNQLAEFSALTDSLIPAVGDFRPLADSLWRSFMEPLPLDSMESLWLVLDPETVQVTPMTGTGRNITTTLVLYARPRVVAGRKPILGRKPLPVLSLGSAPTEFRVPVAVELPFNALEEIATQTLSQETAKQSVRIDSVFLRGSGDTVLVDLAVSGALSGRLSLVSRPRWDSKTKELRLDDLEWTIQSRGRLATVKAALAAPLIGRAVRRATNGGRLSLSKQLDAARTELLRKLNGGLAPGVVMGSSVREIQIVDVKTTLSAVVVRAYLSGQSGVWIQ